MRGNVLGNMFNFSIDLVFFIKIFSKCDLCGMSLRYILELIINKKNYLRKKFDDFSVFGKLFFYINREKIYMGEIFFEFI